MEDGTSLVAPDSDTLKRKHRGWTSSNDSGSKGDKGEDEGDDSGDEGDEGEDKDDDSGNEGDEGEDEGDNSGNKGDEGEDKGDNSMHCDRNSISLHCDSESLIKLSRVESSYCSVMVKGVGMGDLLRDFQRGLQSGELKGEPNTTYNLLGKEHDNPHHITPISMMDPKHMAVVVQATQDLNRFFNKVHGIEPENTETIVPLLRDAASNKAGSWPGPALLHGFRAERLVMHEGGRGIYPVHGDAVTGKHLWTITINLTPGLPTLVVGRIPGERDLLELICECKHEADWLILCERLEAAYNPEVEVFASLLKNLQEVNIVDNAYPGTLFFADSGHCTVSTEELAPTRIMATWQVGIARNNPVSPYPTWWSRLKATKVVAEFSPNLSFLSAWTTIQRPKIQDPTVRFKAVKQTIMNHNRKTLTTAKPVEAPTLQHEVRVGICSHRCMFRVGLQMNNRCMAAECEDYSCGTCSAVVLGEFLSMLKMSGQNEEICNAFESQLGYAAFRLCFRHSNSKTTPILADNRVRNLLVLHQQYLSDADDEWRANTRVADPTGEEKSLFKTHIPDLISRVGASAATMFKLKYTSPESSIKMCALRKLPILPIPGLTNDEKKWYRAVQKNYDDMYDQYTKSYNVDSLSLEGWSNATIITQVLLKACQFPCPDGPQKLVVHSVRNNFHKESKFHIDNRIFGDSGIAAYCTHGSYRLAFVTNPLEVLTDDAPPTFQAVEISAGDAYVMTGDYFRAFPHAPIACNGTGLNRQVLLFGFTVFPNANYQLHKSLLRCAPRFYHFREKNGSIISEIPDNAIDGKQAEVALRVLEEKNRSKCSSSRGCGLFIVEDKAVQCRNCHLTFHAFRGGSTILQKLDGITPECSFQVSLKGPTSGSMLQHECKLCKVMFDDQEENAGVSDRTMLGIKCVTCNQACPGKNVCSVCGVYVHAAEPCSNGSLEGNYTCTACIKVLAPTHKKAPTRVLPPRESKGQPVQSPKTSASESRASASESKASASESKDNTGKSKDNTDKSKASASTSNASTGIYSGAVYKGMLLTTYYLLLTTYYLLLITYYLLLTTYYLLLTTYYLLPTTYYY
jgi:hypothetical protein